MALERRTDGAAVPGIPEPERLVLTSRHNAAAVGAEGHAQHPILMASERRSDGPAAPSIPEPQRLVLTSRDDARAVGAEGQLSTQSSWP
jgi:hypothetical protein